MNYVISKPSNNKYLVSPNNQLIMYCDSIIAWFFENKVDKLSEISIEYLSSQFNLSIKDIHQKFSKYAFIKNKITKCDQSKLLYSHSPSVYSEQLKVNLANIPMVLFEVTQSCNLKCKYCGYGELYEDYKPRKDNKLQFEIAKNFIDYLIKLWTTQYNISYKDNITFGFYGGEPLLNFPLILKIVKYLSSIKVDNVVVKFNMTTNGILLDKYIDELIKYDFSLLVSIDGNCENNAYRVFKDGNPSFNKLKSNLLYVKDRYPKYFREKIQFTSVLHNLNSVEEIIDFIESNFAKKPRISSLSITGIREEKKHVFNEMFRDYFESLALGKNTTDLNRDRYVNDEEPNDLIYFLHAYSGNVFKNYNDFFRKKNKAVYSYTGTCSPFSRRVFITTDGRILPCERIDQAFTLGKVDSSNVEINFSEVAERYTYYYKSFMSTCDVCKNKSTCLQCIFNVYDLNVKNCKSYMNEKYFMNYINDIFSILETYPEAYSHAMEDIIIE